MDFYIGNTERYAFETLKVKLSETPILNIYDPTADTELHTDACQDGYAAVLMQVQTESKMLLPIHYISKKTTPAEAKYDSYQLEALAVIKGVEKYLR